jgi:hypothetical protein
MLKTKIVKEYGPCTALKKLSKIESWHGGR